MAVAERRATAIWEGNLTEGKGKFSTGSGVLTNLGVTWASRTEQSDGLTSPEELIAAAHATCFSMALSNGLAKAGNAAEHLTVTAICSLDRVDGKMTIVSIDLDVEGIVSGIGEGAFRKAAEEAGLDCPVSRALKGNIKINVTASLSAAGDEGDSTAVSNTVEVEDFPAQKPSQAEGDRETIDADIRQKEREGKL